MLIILVNLLSIFIILLFLKKAVVVVYAWLYALPLAQCVAVEWWISSRDVYCHLLEAQ